MTQITRTTDNTANLFTAANVALPTPRARHIPAQIGESRPPRSYLRATRGTKGKEDNTSKKGYRLKI